MAYCMVFAKRCDALSGEIHKSLGFETKYRGVRTTKARAEGLGFFLALPSEVVCAHKAIKDHKSDIMP